MQGLVVAVSVSPTHTMQKNNVTRINLLEGLGVEGDAHMGETVKHRSRVARDPSQPNLRQVHLIHAELLDELAAAGFELETGRMGENITTRGLDLLGLPTGTRLLIGKSAIVEVTGLRNPCLQLNGIAPGLMNAVLDRDADGNLVRKAGVMGVVIAGGRGDAGRQRPRGTASRQPLAPATRLIRQAYMWMGAPVTARAASFTASDMVGCAKHMRAMSSELAESSIAIAASAIISPALTPMM